MYFAVLVISFTLFFAWLYLYLFYWARKGVPTIKESFLKSSLDILFLRESIWKFIEKLYNRYDTKYIGFFMLNTPALFVKDLDFIKRILVKDFEYFPDRTLGRNPDADKLGAHILFLTQGAYWKSMRSKVTTAYSTTRINLQIPLMEEVAKNLCKYIENHEKQVMNVKETCAKYSTDAITISAYGISGNSFQGSNDNYRSVTEKIFAGNFMRGLNFSFAYVAPFLLKTFRMTFLDKWANKRLEETYQDQMQIKKETGVNRNDFLDFLIELSAKESDPKFKTDNNAMISQAAQYFLAGFETIGSIFAYILLELAKHPDVQSRLREEIRDGMKGHDCLSMSLLNNMIYLDMILRESLRIYPILPFLDRKVSKDYKIPDTDIVLEKGTNIYISTIGMHYDPKYFPDPHKFDPERFSPENKHNIQPFTYLPIGAGPRICIGARYGIMTIKVGVLEVIRNFSVTTCPQTTTNLKYIPGSFILVPTTNVDLVFNKL